MNTLFSSISAEFIKLKHAKIVWVTFIAFGLGPIMGGVFMLIMKDPETLANAGTIGAKAQLMGMSADWPSYLNMLAQVMGVGGVIVYGFLASWLFGREYSESTAKDLLALPTSRAKIIHSKFAVYLLWCLCLAFSNLILGLIIGWLVQLPMTDWNFLPSFIITYFLTTTMTIGLGTPLAFLANWGKGYLLPLGFVVLMLVFSQILAAVGYGNYFPWAIPGIFSGVSTEYKALLDLWSYFILAMVFILGYAVTIVHWTYTDHTE